MSRLALPASCGLLIALCLGPHARPARGDGPPRIFLSWNAPYGSPRALQDLSVSCDSSRRDTLYVCFDPGQDSTELVSVEAEIRLWPAEGDTLDRAWWFESRSNPAVLRADFNPEGAPGAQRPWTAQGVGAVRTLSTADSAKIKLIWAVASREFAMIYGGRMYAFARLIVPRPARPEICARPLCMELAAARLVYKVGSRDLVRRGIRWVTWNRGGGHPCGQRSRMNMVEPWYPRSRRP